jgi:type VI secretion system protein ImpJ
VKRVKYGAARVHWQMGQALLPEHFYAQEYSLRDELGLRLDLSPSPAWGLGALRLDPFQLVEGIVSIQELTLVTSSGTLIDVPGNTEPAAFNLNGTGSTRTPVYVHLASGFKVAAVRMAGDPDEEGIERIVQRIELSAQPYSDSAAQVFKLGEFERDPEGVWHVTHGYVPAMLRVTGIPMFDGVLGRMKSIAEKLERLLTDEIQTNYLAGESQAAGRECLRGLFEFRASLVDVAQGIEAHPACVFRRLRSLYIHVCVYRGVDPALSSQPYQHEAPAEAYEALLEALEQQIDLRRSETPYVAFTRREGMLVCDIPPAAKKARNVYWLVQKPRVASVLDTAGVKLAGESRLNVVHQRALRGIAYQRIDPPFHHNFSAQVEFHRLSPGEEWDHAVRDGRIACFEREELRGTRSFLYWRMD